MTEVVLETMIGESDAQRLIREKAPSFQVLRSELAYRPYSGFVYRLETRTGRSRRVHTLVDRLSGKTSITEPWRTTALRDPKGRTMDDSEWGQVSFAEARRRSRQAVDSTAQRSKSPVAGNREVDERLRHPTVWKPSWVLDGVVGGRDVRVLVDAVDGGSTVDGP
ncbi:hypothetical protein [Zhihengliuella salsuginis]|uniref:Uncharacterized protein n=1 Tax=Zhihengliuella salsuginis TaxID=578222 RepID=A0ABQ3GK79_9MICC|nr:hypothetical protein [Zhihengliuella salsuginis]GHD06471.1 hypothetical protein GCM10008096_16500 [Zhihengliuella salsuginis]